MGVYLVVVGLLLDIFSSLGSALDRDIHHEDQPADRSARLLDAAYADHEEASR